MIYQCEYNDDVRMHRGRAIPHKSILTNGLRFDPHLEKIFIYNKNRAKMDRLALP